MTDPTKPPVGYIVWPVNDSYRLDIPGELDLVPYPTLQEAVDAAWGHYRSVASPCAPEGLEPLTGDYNAMVEQHARDNPAFAAALVEERARVEAEGGV